MEPFLPQPSSSMNSWVSWQDTTPVVSTKRLKGKNGRYVMYAYVFDRMLIILQVTFYEVLSLHTQYTYNVHCKICGGKIKVQVKKLGKGEGKK